MRTLYSAHPNSIDENPLVAIWARSPPRSKIPQGIKTLKGLPKFWLVRQHQLVLSVASAFVVALAGDGLVATAPLERDGKRAVSARYSANLTRRAGQRQRAEDTYLLPPGLITPESTGKYRTNDQGTDRRIRRSGP